MKLVPWFGLLIISSGKFIHKQFEMSNIYEFFLNYFLSVQLCFLVPVASFILILISLLKDYYRKGAKTPRISSNFNINEMENMGSNIVVIGNSGKDVKSDCQVTLQFAESGGIQINIESKVQALYGKSIRKLAEDMLVYYNVKHASILIEDSGALDFVIAARIEAAVRKLIKTEKEFSTVFLNQDLIPTQKERNRISRLYIPGNNPKLMINAGIYHPDAIILDLEDSVSPDKKFEARFLVRNALRTVDFYGAERMVRINQLPLGLDDLEFIVPQHPNLVLIPKCESAGQVKQVNEKIREISQKNNISSNIWLMPIIESAKGVLSCYEIAFAAENIAAMAIGLEDFTADIGVARTFEGTESLFARQKLIIACKAAGIQAIDSVFSDIDDLEALKKTINDSKALGFSGMGCIHPRQIKVIHENYAPGETEIERAKKIFVAYKEAEASGSGVVALGSKMIDAPVVKKALNTIKLAIEAGKLPKNWQEEI
jgi:citrate lyase subunit beta/citryl-CoA lyase